MTLNGTRISMQFVVLFFIVHIIVNFDLLIAMLLNNCCKIIVSSCNPTVDMHIHGKVSKKSAFFCKSESSTDWTNWLSIWRLRYSLHYAMPLCTQMRLYFLYFAMQTKNAVDIWPRCLSRLDEIWLNACIGILTNIK